MKKTSRRDFLAKGAAIASASAIAPFLRLPTAHAAGTVAPLRLITVFSPFQIPEIFYHPQVSATNSAFAPAGVNFNLNFPNSVLAPLSPYQSDLIIFRGIKYSGGPDSHSTNTLAFTGSKPGGTSIDQYLNQRMARAGSLSPFCAAPFGYSFGDHLNDVCISFNKGNPTSQIANPINLYNSLFGNIATGGGTAAQFSAARRQQTLGLVKNYLTSMKGRLPSTSVSYSVLESHLAAAKGLESQIMNGGNTCTPPVKASITNDPGPDNGSNNPALANPDFASFNKIITQALACDLTRFCSFKMSDSGDPGQDIINQMPGLENFSQATNFHGGITHATTGLASSQIDITMAKFKMFFMSQVANLLASLKTVADPFNPAQTLYDNTVVLIASEGPIQTPGSNTHGQGDINSDSAFIIAGGCGGYFKKGQLLFAGGGKQATVHHNAILTNIVNTFEKNQQQFNPNYVPMILNQYGEFPFVVSPTAWLA